MLEIQNKPTAENLQRMADRIDAGYADDLRKKPSMIVHIEGKNGAKLLDPKTRLPQWFSLDAGGGLLAIKPIKGVKPVDIVVQGFVL